MDRYDLDNDKIKNFIISNLDYTNIKNIYYAFKLSNILDLEVPFNLIDGVNLVEQIFSEIDKEYYLTKTKNNIEQEIVLWISEMIKDNFFQYNTGEPTGSSNINVDPAIPIALVFIIVPGAVIFVSTKQLNGKKRRFRTSKNSDKNTKF